MKKISLIHAIVLVLLLQSCVAPPKDIDIPTQKSKLVVASQVIPGEVMVVGVTRSFSVLTNTYHDSLSLLESLLVKNAIVKINWNGQTEELIELTDGIYISRAPLKDTNTVFSLHVYDPATQQHAYATATMLPAPNVVYVQPIIKNNSEISMTYKIQDDPGKSNYFMVNYYLPNRTGRDSMEWFPSNLSGDVFTNVDLLSDKEFTNGFYETRKLLSIVGDDPDAALNRYDTLGISISNISEDYYKFLVTRKKAGNLINQISGEPINYPTNVVGGYGFFNVHHPSIHIFDLNEW